MRHSDSLQWIGGLAAVAALACGLTLVACPLSHDGYETDRPCWSQADCVSQELCGKPDGGALGSGICAIPSEGPCGPLDAGIPGYFCFPDQNGTARSCYYDPEDTCIECTIDGGLLNCPPQECLAWRGRYGCQ